MPSIEAFLDDYGLVQAYVNRRYYNGQADVFYLTSADEQYECVITNVEEHEREIRYFLKVPKDLEFGKQYYLFEGRGYSAPLKNRFIVHTDKFVKDFTYTGNDLGSRYTKQQTTFKIFAPTAISVVVKIFNNKEESFYKMKRKECGVFETSIQGDFKHALYSYIVERDGEMVECLDPYAYSSNANGRKSAVIDFSELEKIAKVTCKTPFKHAVDAIIYECSIRDMTSLKETNTKTHGKFVSLLEEGTSYQGKPTGLDYLTSLGITHVQFQPLVDFATVDEEHIDRMYNWGYDPAQFVPLDGSYASDPNDPYARMVEFKQLVSKLHSKDIRVNVDMVFNHVYDQELNAVNKILPYYYFRYNNRGYCSNGSFCGNDLASEQPMVFHLFKFVLENFLTTYDVDGFRFDLMGILDVDSVNALYESCKKIKANIMFYGEGWNMPTCLEDCKKAMLYNQDVMPEIGHFNDVFRDVLKGKTSDDQLYDQGYLTGNCQLAHDACSCLAAHTRKQPYFYRFDHPSKSINAIETHDNATLWDKMHFSNRNEPRELRKLRQKSLIATTLFAQGVPFLHAGIEFLGTKNDLTNTYNSSDAINGMNYDRMIHNYDVVEYSKACIAFRKQHEEFRLCSKDEIEQFVYFGIDERNVVFYSINWNGHETCVIINPNTNDCDYDMPDVEIIFDENGKRKEGKQSHILVPACSVIVIRK